MFCATPLRTTVKETVYLTVVDATVAKTVYLTVVDTTVAKTVYSTVIDTTVAKTVYLTVVDTTVAKTVYSTVETAQQSMALLGHGNLETFAAMRKAPDDIHLYLLFRFSFN